MKKDRIFPCVLILMGVVVLLGYIVLRLAQENSKIKSALPYLMHGENIEYFNLIGMDNEEIDVSVLKKSTVSLIFVFNTCSECNKNILYWNKLAGILKKKISIYGIVLDTLSNVYNFSEASKLNFRLYSPDSIEELKRNFRLKLDIAQTILCCADKVKYITLGELNIAETTKILEMINEI